MTGQVGDPSGAAAADAPDAPTVTAVAERDWLESAFREHYPALVRLATLLVDRNVAEEIVQDAFVRTHGKLHRVDPDKVPQYLRAAVVNGSRSRLRRREVRRRHDVPDISTAPAAEVGGIAGATRAEVLRALDGLPTRQREVLILRYYADLSEQEIAAVLGLSTGSVKTHAHRGLAALSTTLGAVAPDRHGPNEEVAR